MKRCKGFIKKEKNKEAGGGEKAGNSKKQAPLDRGKKVRLHTRAG